MFDLTVYAAFFLGLVLYFLPAAIAYGREHRNAGPILIVNIFLGWTLLGWVAALAWSATND
jgi:Superinfection immunity protein